MYQNTTPIKSLEYRRRLIAEAANENSYKNEKPEAVDSVGEKQV